MAAPNHDSLGSDLLASAPIDPRRANSSLCETLPLYLPVSHGLVLEIVYRHHAVSRDEKAVITPDDLIFLPGKL